MKTYTDPKKATFWMRCETLEEAEKAAHAWSAELCESGYTFKSVKFYRQFFFFGDWCCKMIHLKN